MSGRFLAAFRRRQVTASSGSDPTGIPPSRPGSPGSKRGLRRVVRDFLLIVAGVLTALGLESWSAERAERRLEAEYLAALAEDTRAHLAQYDRWLSVLERHRGWTATIWGWANGSAPSPEQPIEEVLLWVRLGGQIHLNTRFQEGAYQDLVNSGRLGLIRNRTVREALVGYHNNKARWSAIVESRGTEAAERYADAAAGVIPPEVAWLVTTNQDLAPVDLEPILAELRNREAVRHALVGLAQSHDFQAGSATRSRQQAAELLDLLEGELGQRARQRRGEGR